MRSLVIIWLLVLVTLVGGAVYMNHAINSMVESLPEARTAVLTPRTSLKVVYNYQEQKTANINVLEPKVSDVYLQYGSNGVQGSSNESN
jgi:flagellar basal body-associated protein FliL